MPDEKSAENNVVASLRRMQDFDASSLPQTTRLGQDLDFGNAVSPAKRLIALYRQLSPNVIPDLPQNRADSIKSVADADFSRLEEIRKFDPKVIGNPGQARDQLVNSIVASYNNTFNELHPYISYSASKTTDFQRLETEQRSRLQSISDAADKLMQQLEQQKTDAERILVEVRATAAEQGVSQQAIYFSTEAVEHSKEASWWLKATSVCACAVFLWSLFGPKALIWVGYTDVQLGVSKVLSFGVLSFLTYLSAKNFLSHKHNNIVNKHRQNALATYRALVEAAGSPGVADVVLTHASACIFAPQATGYAGGKSVDGATAKSVVEFLGKPMTGGE